jgi:hypothetical protein
MLHEHLIYGGMYLVLTVLFFYLSRNSYRDLKAYLTEDTCALGYCYIASGIFCAIVSPKTYLKPTEEFRWAHFLLVFSPLCGIIFLFFFLLALGEIGFFPIHWRPFL